MPIFTIACFMLNGLYLCLSARRVNQLLHKGWVKPGQVLWLTSQWVAEPGKGETSSAGYQQKRFHHKICSGYQQRRLLQRHLQTDWQHAASFPQQAHPPPVFFWHFCSQTWKFDRKNKTVHIFSARSNLPGCNSPSLPCSCNPPCILSNQIKWHFLSRKAVKRKLHQ